MIAKRAITTVIVRGGSAIANLSMVLLINRAVGMEEGAIVITSWIYACFLANMCRCGSDVLLLRQTSQQYRCHHGLIAGTLLQCGSIAVVASICTAVLVFCFSSPIAGLLFDNSIQAKEPLRLLAISVPFLCVNFLVIEAIKGTKCVEVATFLHSGLVPTSLSFAIFVGSNDNILQFSTTILWSAIASAIISIAVLSTRLFPLESKLKFLHRRVILESLPRVWVADLLRIQCVWIPLSLLGYYSTDLNVGLFATVWKMSMATNVIIVAFNNAFGPKFARLMANPTNRKAYELLFGFVNTTFIIICLVVMLLVAAFGKTIAERFVVLQFEAGLKLLQILLLGQIGYGLAIFSASALNMSSKEALATKSSVAGFIANSIIAICFIPHFGAPAAAIAIAVGFLIQSLFNLRFVNNHLGMKAFPLLQSLPDSIHFKRFH